MEENDKFDLEVPLLQSEDSVTINIPRDADERLSTVNFVVKGIVCASCATSIDSVLKKLDGIEYVAVSTMDGRTIVKYVPGLINEKTIKDTIEEVGFTVEGSLKEDNPVCRTEDQRDGMYQLRRGCRASPFSSRWSKKGCGRPSSRGSQGEF